MLICRPWPTLAMLLAVLAVAGCGSPSGEPVAASITGGEAPKQVGGGEVGSASSTSAPSNYDPVHPVVEIATDRGTITVELDAEHSPVTVGNFLSYVTASHYDQTVFHYVQPGGMIAGGGFTADLQPKEASLPIRNEAHNGLTNKRGTIAMSRPLDSIDSATDQFFINLADNPALDHREATEEGYGYCVFGRVTSGLEIADQLSETPTHDAGDFISTPQQPLVIKSIRQVR